MIMLESFKTHQLHIAAGAFGEVPSGQPSRPLQFQSEPDVIDYSPPRHQSEILKHYGAIAPRAHNRFSVDTYAPAGGLDQAPAMDSSRLLFPQPLGPTIVTKVPRAMSRFTLETAMSAPAALGFSLTTVRLTTCMCGSGSKTVRTCIENRCPHKS